MTTDRDLDLITAAWLAEGPDELSDRVLDSVTDKIHTTRQRRRLRLPWRSQTMSLPMRAAAAAVIGVLVIGGLALLASPGQPSVAGPAATPTPTAVPTATPSASTGTLRQTFTSPRYGYAIRYPAGWVTTPATTSWRRGAETLWGDAALDAIGSSEARLSVASQALGSGQTADAWLVAYCGASGTTGDSCGPSIAIGDKTGFLDEAGAPASGGTVTAGGVIYDAAVVADGHGYEFTLDGHVDRAMFDAFLATVTFPVIPALDRTYTSTISGYSIGYPSAWAVTQATQPWTAGYDTMTYSDSIGTGSITMYGTSRKLPAGMSFENWFAAYDADRVLGTRCGVPSLNEDVTVDGFVGKLDVHCPASYLEAVIPKGGRVYVFTMFYPYNRPLFEALLGTVRLTPETATP